MKKPQNSPLITQEEEAGEASLDKPSANNKLKKYFFFTASGVILAGIATVYYKPELIFRSLNMLPQTTVTGHDIQKEQAQSIPKPKAEEVEKDVKEADEPKQPEVPASSMVSTRPEIKKEKPGNQSVIQPPEILTLPVDESQAKSVLSYNKESLRSYRRYLAAVNFITIQFLQDKAFTSQLDELKSNKLNSSELPETIVNILSLLERYNAEYLVNYQEQKQPVFLRATAACTSTADKILSYGAGLLSRFVKVEKLPESSKEKNVLRAKILENLPRFSDVLHSEELQNIFVGKVSK